ncbi:MAG TPA: hypothetical protein VFY84_18735 [Jiangellales bacterium]|nr:hypothetical protein [Jiangellales bacterium]
MPVRDSKRALADVAAMLGTDSATARAFLRTVQHLAGPVPYDQIAEAMRRVGVQDPERVAQAVASAEGERTDG